MNRKVFIINGCSPVHLKFFKSLRVLKVAFKQAKTIDNADFIHMSMMLNRKFKAVKP
jgi:hypothetical protein